MLTSVKANQKKLFIDLSAEFYNSPAVLHSVPKKVHEATFEELVNGRGAYIEAFFIEPEGNTAGYCIVGKGFSPECGGKVAWIEEIYIKEEFRSQGVGKAVLKEIFERFGAKRYRLEVEPSNLRAAELYKTLGFKKLEYVQFILDV